MQLVFESLNSAYDSVLESKLSSREISRRGMQVVEYLHEHPGTTHKQIVLDSEIPSRTIRYWLDRLKKQGLAIRKPSFRDTRQHNWYLNLP